MKASARGLTADRSRFGFQRLLVVVQVSISLMLVAGAFLFVSSFSRPVTMDPGFRAQGVLQMNFEMGRPVRRSHTPSARLPERYNPLWVRNRQRAQQ